MAGYWERRRLCLAVGPTEKSRPRFRADRRQVDVESWLGPLVVCKLQRGASIDHLNLKERFGLDNLRGNRKFPKETSSDDRPSIAMLNWERILEDPARPLRPTLIHHVLLRHRQF